MSASLQDQKLTELQFGVGVIKEKTQLDAGGFWTDADKVRFRFGRPELMGGWQRAIDASQDPKIFGVPRYLTSVRNKLGQAAVFIATHNGLFSSELSTFYEITPITASVSASNILSTTSGSTKVVVSVSAHGLTDQTLVGIVSAGTTIGGNILINPVVSTEVLFEVSVVDANSFSVDVGVTAAATSVATGGSTTLRFRYNAGGISTVPRSGWGTGPWGGNFGWSTPFGTVSDPLRLWSADLWGTDILAVPSKGPLMYWETSANITSRLTIVTAAPSVNQIVRVASEARHVLLYGTHDISGNYSPLLIRWCTQEDFTDWTPTATNTAGDYPLPSRGSEIRAVNRIGDKTAILTDNDLYIQSYIGGNDVFGFTAVGEQCGVIARNAAVEYSGTLYWMSPSGQFFQYDGRLQPLACTVLRFVYDNLDPRYEDKIYAATNSTFDEVMWFYASKDSPNGENDRYVIYNTRERHWTIGTMARTVWEDSNTFDYPLAIDDNAANLYYQESGYAADSSALAANLEGAYFDQDSGDNILFINKFVPDFANLEDGTPYSGTLNVSLKARKYPGGPVITKGPFAVTGTTQKVSTRLRGRELAIQIQSSTVNDTPWRMGQFRMAIEPDGLR
jgi:hypothetical protein